MEDNYNSIKGKYKDDNENLFKIDDYYFVL